MKKIVLLCVAGMSTSLLVSRMQNAAKETDFPCEIQAYGVAEAPNVIPGADVVLLGPQVRYMLSKLKKEYPDKKIEAVDMRIYGMVDGKQALMQARKIMEC
ncbi:MULTISPECIES: PTS sugar transporter subunit IIB [Eubacteriales]|uniref:PTS sugar transporter subunit IIB n=1 Tax=Eubacteriales TaxID=186802 RepID=UPI00056DBC8A|nr:MULTISPECIES: PTS sugar transporter subunit IIB [Eubacteriales]MBE6831289.1 PTS sugar transporter subunit IIB [Oscillospiraceae bacterium]MDF1493281.1 PTS sugar transporter subunit IIB [Caproiciproducens sp. CPB-2]TQI68723.1 PTS system cellobiose-specific IIB component [Clostridium sp. KNHs216]